jgi:hypothetical protein
MSLDKYKALIVELRDKPEADDIERAATYLEILVGFTECAERTIESQNHKIDVWMCSAINLKEAALMWEGKYHAMKDEYDKLKLAYDQLTM